MTLLRELRFAGRRLARTPLFTGIATLTLGVGIGANSAIFSVVDGVLLKPLPYREPENLVGIGHSAAGLGAAGRGLPTSEAIYFTYRSDNRAFEDIGIFDQGSATITGNGPPERVRSLTVTDGTLAVLGATPIAGRRFGPADDAPGAPPTVMLSHAFWQRRFGGDPAAIGQNLPVDGTPHQIIGVLPRGFRVLQNDPAVYLPARLDPARAQVMAFRYQLLGRLRPGVTLAMANADLARLLPIAFERYPSQVRPERLRQMKLTPKVIPLRDEVVGDVGRVLWVLLGTVGIVLLVACANVANLFLVRIETRQREVAVQAALGAPRSRIMAGLVAESLILCALGGALGLALAYGGLRLLIGAGGQSLPRIDEIGIDGRVLAFTSVVSLLAAGLFGLLPAFRLARRELYGALKQSAPGGGTSPGWARAQNGMVVIQVALALVLLIGSGLMVRSVHSLREVDPGFRRPEQVLTFRLFIPEAEVPTTEGVAALERTILDRIGAVPGVVRTGASWIAPMSGAMMTAPIQVDGAPEDPDRIAPPRRHSFITPGYPETLQQPVVAGRAFTWDDLAARANVALVSENLARDQWGSAAAAVGKRIQLGAPGSEWHEVVGVLGNLRDDGVAQDAPTMVFWPMTSNILRGEGSRSFSVAVRAAGPPAGLLPALQRAVWSANPNLPLAEVRSLEAILETSMARSAFAMVMLTVAAAAGLLLGLVGIYGVISYVVTRRVREIGLRIALGARPADVQRMVVRQAAVVSGVGVAVGLAGASGLTRLMAGLLHGVRPLDPITFATVALLVAAVAIAASLVPARRAARIAPIIALRTD